MQLSTQHLFNFDLELGQLLINLCNLTKIFLCWQFHLHHIHSICIDRLSNNLIQGRQCFGFLAVDEHKLVDLVQKSVHFYSIVDFDLGVLDILDLIEELKSISKDAGSFSDQARFITVELSYLAKNLGRGQDFVKITDDLISFLGEYFQFVKTLEVLVVLRNTLGQLLQLGKKLSAIVLFRWRSCLLPAWRGIILIISSIGRFCSRTFPFGSC